MASDKKYTKTRVEEAYGLYKAMGYKRIPSQELANTVGVSRTTLYKWRDQYKWEERYAEDTKEERAAFEAEIKNRMEDGARLIDVIRDEMLMQYAIRVKGDNFKFTLDDLKTVFELSEKYNARLDALERESDNKAPQSVNVTVSFDAEDDEDE